METRSELSTLIHHHPPSFSKRILSTSSQNLFSRFVLYFVRPLPFVLISIYYLTDYSLLSFFLLQVFYLSRLFFEFRRSRSRNRCRYKLNSGKTHLLFVTKWWRRNALQLCQANLLSRRVLLLFRLCCLIPLLISPVDVPVACFCRWTSRRSSRFALRKLPFNGIFCDTCRRWTSLSGNFESSSSSLYFVRLSWIGTRWIVFLLNHGIMARWMGVGRFVGRICWPFYVQWSPERFIYRFETNN